MSGTITLGGRPFALRPLKLGQLRHLLDALDGMAGKSGGALIEAAAHIVAAGLAPAHPELTSDRVLELEATIDELNTAIPAILRVAGLRPREDGLGEAAAPEHGQSTPAAPGVMPQTTVTARL